MAQNLKPGHRMPANGLRNFGCTTIFVFGPPRNVSTLFKEKSRLNSPWKSPRNGSILRTDMLNSRSLPLRFLARTPFLLVALSTDDSDSQTPGVKRGVTRDVVPSRPSGSMTLGLSPG